MVDKKRSEAGKKAAKTRKSKAAKKAAQTRGKKAAATRKRRAAGKKAAQTRKRKVAGKKAAQTKKAATASAQSGKANSSGAPAAYRGDQGGCPKCSARPGDGIIEVDVNSVRHWIAYVDFKNPNDAGLDNRKIKQLGRKDLEPYFAPLEFVGWHRLTPHWEHVLSPAKKDVSNTFVFYGANIPSDYWGLEELKKYLRSEKKHSGGSSRVKELARG